MIKVCNLYAGMGGNRKLWEDVDVTAVEIVPEIAEVYRRNFPNTYIVTDEVEEFIHKADQRLFLLLYTGGLNG